MHWLILAGRAESTDYPVSDNAFQPIFGGGSQDAFITELSLDGNQLLFSTYLGGEDNDQIEAIALEREDDIILIGVTQSEDFFTTEGSYQMRNSGERDAFITWFSARSIQPIYSTFFGGESWDYGRSVISDGFGGIIVVGDSESRDFPTTNGAFDQEIGIGGDAFISCFMLSLKMG